ncbi:Isochorismatase-like protein, partial [Elsinoe ampelina]
NETLSFGKNYAVLNLDLINGIVGSVVNTTQGDAWIRNTARWIDAVHATASPPLTIFTRIFFSTPQKPEIGPNAPFAQVGGALGTSDDPLTEIFPAFTVEENDAVLTKIRYYAGAGNALEEILSSQGIDTVVLSGIRTSGVIISTAYRLFDLDYKVYVIANNTIESPPDTPDINNNILSGILPKLPVDVITLEQALGALNRSGP